MRLSPRTFKIGLLIVTASASLAIGHGCAKIKLLAAAIPPAIITLEIQNYCPKSGFQYVDHFAYNSSASFDGTIWSTDIDRDGLSDNFERDPINTAAYATSYLSSDTNGNGYSDLVKVRLGLRGQQQNFMPICNNPGIDTDNDGLSDCEEAVIGTDPTQADFDLDGVPDGLEMRFGMNPMDSRDVYTASTGDGLTNLQKVKMGVAINTYMNQTAQGMVPVYSSKTDPATGCSTLQISNIYVVPVDVGNMLKVIALEDNQTPPTNGTHSVDRQARTLSVLVPSTITNGSKVVVPDGIHGQGYGDVGQPPIKIVGGFPS